MIKIIDKGNKVAIESTTQEFMPSIVFKSQLIRISHNTERDHVIMYFSNDRLIVSYIYLDPIQRTELGINSNADLMSYFDSIT